MKDVRDNTRIATLPDDLKDIANRMLEDKFDLPKEGEVVEKKERDPSLDYGASAIDPRAYSTRPGYIQVRASGNTISLDDLRRAQDALRKNKPTQYGMTAKQWLDALKRNDSFAKASYHVNVHQYEIQFEGVHTRQIYRSLIDSSRLHTIHDQVEYIEAVQKSVQREMMEPTIIRDPRGHY